MLELEFGLELPSLAAALAGGRVLATDWSPQAIELLEHNAARNGAAMRPRSSTGPSPQAIVERAPWDLVLAADVLYERRNVPLLSSCCPACSTREENCGSPIPAARPPTVLLEGLAEGWKRRSEADGRVTVHRLLRAAVPFSSR